MTARAIVRDRDILHGTPAFAGTRIPPQSPWSFYRSARRHGSHAAGVEAALTAYPTLTEADVEAATRFCERRRPVWALQRRVAAGLRALAEAIEPWGSVS